MRVFRSAAAFLTAAAAVAVPSVALAPVASADCPDIEVIFARGTDDTGGLGTVGDALERLQFERRIARIRRKALRQRNTHIEQLRHAGHERGMISPPL